MKRIFTAIRTSAYAICFASVWIWIALVIHSYDSTLGTGLPAWMLMPAIAFLVAGGILVIASVASFIVRGEGTPAPFDAPRRFVASGPYRHVRNPMYIGGWMALVGFGLLERSGLMVIFSCVWILIVHLFVLAVEEPGLERRFGQTYLQYKLSVRRWIPSQIGRSHRVRRAERSSP